jgi:hypothetical protein
VPLAIRRVDNYTRTYRDGTRPPPAPAEMEADDRLSEPDNE